MFVYASLVDEFTMKMECRAVTVASLISSLSTILSISNQMNLCNFQMEIRRHPPSVHPSFCHSAIVGGGEKDKYTSQ